MIEGPSLRLGRLIGRVNNFISPATKAIGEPIKVVGNAIGFMYKQMQLAVVKMPSFFDKIGGLISKAKSKFDGMQKGGGGSGESFKDKILKWSGNFNLASIAANMKNLTGDTGNLTNALEAQMVAMRQTTKPIIAQLNISGKEMAKMNAKAGSIAYGLNTDAGSVAETMVAMKTANEGAKKALDALNMSEKDWVKVVQTTQIPMSDYTAILGDMTASWGAAPKDAAAMIDNMMAIGKAAGVGTLALKSTKETLGSLSDTFKSLPPGFKRTSSDIQGLVESTGYLAGALRDMGQAPEEAVSAAGAAAKMFAEQSVIITKAFQIGGPNADLSGSGLFKYLNSLGIGADQVKAIVDLGSRDALAGMKAINDLYAQVGQSKVVSAQSVLSGLGDELGQGASALAFLASSTDKGTAALDKFSGMAVKGDGALKKFGKDAYSSGLTLQEQYDRAKLSFDTTIRSIARGDVRKLVGEQMKGMKEAGQDLLKLGKDSTWGPAVKTLSMFKQMGVGGIFASLAEKSGIGAKNASKFGAKAGLIVDTVSQLGTELAPIAQMFGMMGPFGPLLAAGGIGALFVMDDKSAKEILGPLYEAFKGLKDKIVGFFSSPEFKQKLDAVKNGIKKIWSEDIVPNLPALGSAIYGALKWAWDEIGKQLGSGGQIGVVLAGALATGFGPPLLNAATSAASGFMSVLRGVGGGGTGLIALAGAAAATYLSVVSQKQSEEQAHLWQKTKDFLPGEARFNRILKSGTAEERKVLRENIDKFLQSPDVVGTMASSEEVMGNFASLGMNPEDTPLGKRILQITRAAEMKRILAESEQGNVAAGVSSAVGKMGSNVFSGINLSAAKSAEAPTTVSPKKTKEDINKVLQEQNKAKKVNTVTAIQDEGRATRTLLADIYSELSRQTTMMGGGRGKGGRGSANVSPP